MKKMMTLLCAGCFAAVAAEGNLIKDGDFEKVNEQGKGSAWLVYGGKPGVSAKGLSGKAMSVTAMKSDKYFKTSMLQKLPDLKPGKYILSGNVKGDFYAVYVVVRYQGDPDAKPFTAWLDKRQFTKVGDSGFFRFGATVNVPAKVAGGTLYLEGFATKDNGVMEFDDFALMPQKD